MHTLEETHTCVSLLLSDAAFQDARLHVEVRRDSPLDGGLKGFQYRGMPTPEQSRVVFLTCETDARSL